ncbi:MAG TPA: ATP-binding protein, partial [Polyangiaceae bacterium]|nr:ATP-binding protein [Polyangiaceae bacterium]
MRATDWNHTPLGPIEAWPSCLRSGVALMLASNLATCIVWGQDHIQIYNDAYGAILGPSKHPAIGRSARDTLPEIWFDTLGPMLGEATQGTPLSFEDVQLCLERDGVLEECFFDLSFAPIVDDLGAVGGVHMTVRDTTPRILRERRLQMLAELADAEPTSTRAVWTRAADVLIHQGSEVPFVAFFQNDELVVARGVERASIEAGWPFGRELVVVSDVRRRFGDLVCAPWPEPVQTAVVVPVADAGFLVAGVSPRRTLDDRTQDHWRAVAGRVATSIARARAFEEQQRRAMALVELDRAKTAFFSDMSHEFRTPITLMLGPMDRALVGDALTGEDLRVTHRNALRLLKLVNMLLDFSSIEAGRMRALYEPIEIGRLTAELAAVFRSAVERAGLRFEVDTPPVNQPVYLDREMFEKIVLNLLSNAFKFTFQGTIGVRLRAVSDGVDLTVYDTGEGIATDQLPSLFTRFHRVTGVKARSRHGSGIGLALVHELVKLHGGMLRVDSEVGKGSRFTATFRFGKDHLPQDQLGAPRRALSPVSMSAYADEAKQWLDNDTQSSEVQPEATTRILVVDDNRDMREYLRRILSGQWHVITVSDGAAALEVIQRDPPDLVLADVMMPGLDGFGLLQAMRADKRTKAVPFVMLSARAGEEARIEGFDAGVDDYLIKPFSARELLARVKAQLRLLTARREAELQKQQLYALLMQAPTPIAILRGPAHTIELANGPTCQVWGRAHDELIGCPLFDAIPELRDQLSERLERVRNSGMGYVDKEMPAMFDRQGNGTLETAYFNFVYEPLRNISGAVEGVLLIAFEVTDEVVSRQNMEGLRAEAEAANRAKDEFLAMLGHELRNPLSPIVTALELMSLRAGADNRFQRERQVIERQLGHLIRLVDDLLDVSRIARGKMELKRQPVEIGSVVAKAIELASPLVERRDHRMRVQVPPSGLCVNGDEHRLAQVVANLLTNAAKYTSAGGEIELRAYRDEGE